MLAMVQARVTSSTLRQGCIVVAANWAPSAHRPRPSEQPPRRTGLATRGIGLSRQGNSRVWGGCGGGRISGTPSTIRALFKVLGTSIRWRAGLRRNVLDMSPLLSGMETLDV